MDDIEEYNPNKKRKISIDNYLLEALLAALFIRSRKQNISPCTKNHISQGLEYDEQLKKTQ